MIVRVAFDVHAVYSGGMATPQERREYLEAVCEFHEPNTPPTTCMWCGLLSPCPPYVQAKEALRGV